MKLKYLIFSIFIASLVSFTAFDRRNMEVLPDVKGRQPKAVIDNSGNINLVYGNEDNIYFQQSKDKAKTFSPSELVGSLPEGLMLGMGRGPQIASSNDFTVISAVDKKGNVFAWRKKHKEDNWEGPSRINDVDTVAKEGFVALTQGENNNFYTIWNDLRSGSNQIYGSTSRDGGKTWSKNRLIYSSPDTTICECCKTSIAFGNNKIYAMWRNQLNGYRDMFINSLNNNMENTAEPTKLGSGTWKLDGCPIDGGNLYVDSEGKVTTAWMRKGKVFISEPGKEEVYIGMGRNPVISKNKQGRIIMWNAKGEIMALLPNSTQPTSFGKGTYPSLATHNNFVIAFWEKEDGKLFSKIISN